MRWAILAVSILATATAPAAENLKITPLGSHDGEYCRFDQALILEDPDGTRLLYDVGRTVAGSDDPRLGKIDVVLVSHMYGDHVGDRRIASVNAGECGKPDTRISAAPNMLDAAGLTAYAGPPTGYVLTCSNGLVVYLSDDTGITAEQDSVVRRHYGAKLVVMNIGDTESRERGLKTLHATFRELSMRGLVDFSQFFALMLPALVNCMAIFSSVRAPAN